MIEVHDNSNQPVKKRRATRRWRRSCTVSWLLHASLVGFLASDLAAVMYVALGAGAPTPVVREPIVLEVELADLDQQEPVPEVFLPLEPYDPLEAFAAAEAVAGRMDFTDPALQQPLDYDLKPNDRDSPTVDIQRLVQQNLESARAQADAQTPEQNQQRLDELAERLERSSSAESVNAMVNVIGGVLGTNQRATRPAEEPVAGLFDVASGQLDDVIRREKDPEGYIYIATLIDAEGRQMEVELTGPEGKQAFEAFEKMKRYPLLDRIYRGVVMSLLDGAISK